MHQRPEDQQLPVRNDRPYIHDEVCDDLDAYEFLCTPEVKAALQARKELGTQRYGTPLQAYNGRDALQDLLEELLDAAVYARQATEEGLGSAIAQIQLQTVYQSVLAAACSIRMIQGEL